MPPVEVAEKRWRAGAAIVAAVALALALATGAAAAVLDDASNHFRLDLGDGWTRVPVAAVADGPIVGARHEASGAVLAVSRVDVPNPAAWRGDKAFFREVEDGVAADAPGYKRLHRARRQTIDEVPVLDLVFRHDGADGPETTAIRFIFFRTFSLSAAVSAPTATWKQHEQALDAACAGFTPVR